MAHELGPFPESVGQSRAHVRVIRNHRLAAHGHRAGYEGLSTTPSLRILSDENLVGQTRTHDAALAEGEQYGYRNAQVSVVAPTGTIGLVMDCDTTGIEPDFALVKFKKLGAAAIVKIVNRAVPEALRTLGYRESQIAEMEAYAGAGHASLSNAPAVNTTTLRARGFTDEKLETVERALASAFDIKFVFNKWTLGASSPAFHRNRSRTRISDLLTHLGYSKSEIDAANIHICRGAMTLEGAPHLKGEHYAIFDCANPCGAPQALSLGQVAYSHDGRSGHPLSFGRDLQDHQYAERRDNQGSRKAYALSWRLALKANALIVMASKLSQPLSSQLIASDDEDKTDQVEELIAANVPARAAAVADASSNASCIRWCANARSCRIAARAIRRRRRCHGLLAHRRIRGRTHRRNLHRHA